MKFFVVVAILPFWVRWFKAGGFLAALYMRLTLIILLRVGGKAELQYSRVVLGASTFRRGGGIETPCSCENALSFNRSMLVVFFFVLGLYQNYQVYLEVYRYSSNYTRLFVTGGGETTCSQVAEHEWYIKYLP